MDRHESRHGGPGGTLEILLLVLPDADRRAAAADVTDSELAEIIRRKGRFTHGDTVPVRPGAGGPERAGPRCE